LWYRYHHLFRGLLQQRLPAGASLDQVSELHRRAAAWFAGRSLIDEALSHALAANDLDRAARLMEQGLRDGLNREDRPTLERWLRLLPEEFVQRRSGMLMLKAWALLLSWQLTALAAVLRHQRDRKAPPGQHLREAGGPQALGRRAQGRSAGHSASALTSLAGSPLL
jgi:LuxR family maltose regulon positive regulatory protein